MSKPTKRKRASAPVTDAASAHPSDAPTTETPDRSPSAAGAGALGRPSLAPEPESAAMPSVAEVAADVMAEVTQEKGPTIGLTSNCTVKDAAALKNELLQLLDEPGTVAIDAKSVERIDTAVVQLLCAFVRDRSQRQSGVTWVGTPQPLLDAARLLGVGTLLSLPHEATP